jgi:ABC-2 type transport system ATP-binding protein
MTERITLSDVTFRYRRGRDVLRSFDFEFPAGLTLLLGPNGAGKSTLLGLAASALRPATGRIALGSLTATGRALRAFRRRVAWMPQQLQPFPGLTVREQVAYVGWLKGMAKRDAWERSIVALEQVGLGGFENRSPRKLSGGELRRLGVAQTLVHEAGWILMDEPTSGLDPLQRRQFHTVIGRLRGAANLVISTHQTEDIDSNYDSVVVLSAGRVCFCGTTRAFLALGSGPVGSSGHVVSAYERALAALEP